MNSSYLLNLDGGGELNDIERHSIMAYSILIVATYSILCLFWRNKNVLLLLYSILIVYIVYSMLIVYIVYSILIVYIVYSILLEYIL